MPIFCPRGYVLVWVERVIVRKIINVFISPSTKTMILYLANEREKTWRLAHLNRFLC